MSRQCDADANSGPMAPAARCQLEPAVRAGAPAPTASDDHAASSGQTLELRIDDRPHRVPAGTSLAQLVAGLGHAPGDVCTAVNGSFVARGAREHLALQSGDAVMLFKAIVGG